MTLINSNPEVNKKIDELVNSDYGTITSTLTKRLGPENLIQIDNLVAKSFKVAKADWSINNVPRDPKSKIWQFITDNSGDLFCMKIHNRELIEDNPDRHSINLIYPERDEAVENNATMLFACCHTSIGPATRMALILKILGGYTSSDIARVLSRNELSVIDEINNAKLEILSSKVLFEIPSKYTISERLDNILESLQSIFELGFNHPNHKLKIIPELCHTAIYQMKILVSQPKTNLPKTRALLAYMYFCGSRIPAMTDKNGNLLSLMEQDRAKWNKDMIVKGIDYLYSSANGKEVSIYHLKAGVSAIHSTSAEYSSTNWKQIISLYNNYLELNDCPLSELEKAVAVSRANGPEDGLKLINMIEDKNKIKDNVLLPLAMGNMYLQLHKYDEALGNLTKAMKLSENSIETNYINNKIHICEQRIKMTARYKDCLSF